MPLDFTEFSHHYEGSPSGEAERRAHFETFADIMECLVRYFWQDNPAPNSLGIRFDHDTLAFVDRVESENSPTASLNIAAFSEAAGKKES